MHYSQVLAVVLLLLLPLVQSTRSGKRGLVFIPSAAHPSDNGIWDDASTSDLTWYYNYGAAPSTVYASTPTLPFVPMLFDTSDTNFANEITAQVHAGANITAVMAFNEPDGSVSTGGSAIDPQLAAQTWKLQLAPLRALGLRLGAPAVTGSAGGLAWLVAFFAACQGGCEIDFLPLHWYGDAVGLDSYLGQVRAAYPNTTLWLTEFADPFVSLNASQTFYNQSTQYLDQLSYVERYSYFGSFRSDVSNIGPDAAMLTSDGNLTDIGSWYLGGSATGNIPEAAASAMPRPVMLLLACCLMLHFFRQ